MKETELQSLVSDLEQSFSSNDRAMAEDIKERLKKHDKALSDAWKVLNKALDDYTEGVSALTDTFLRAIESAQKLNKVLESKPFAESLDEIVDAIGDLKDLTIAARTIRSQLE